MELEPVTQDVQRAFVVQLFDQRLDDSRFERVLVQRPHPVPLLGLRVAHERERGAGEQRPFDIPVLADALDPADIEQHRLDRRLERLLFGLAGHANRSRCSNELYSGYRPRHAGPYDRARSSLPRLRPAQTGNSTEPRSELAASRTSILPVTAAVMRAVRYSRKRSIASSTRPSK